MTELNSCSLDELIQLGVDALLAQRIIDFRPFADMEEVMNVPGMDEVELRGALAATVEPGWAVMVENTVQCYENVKLHLPGGPDNIQHAWFGVPGDDRGATCTEQVKELRRKHRAVIVSPAVLGCDPAPGVWKQFRVQLTDATGFRVEEPRQLRCWKTLEEVPSAADGKWVAFIRHAQAGHNADQALVMTPDNPLTDEGIAQALRAQRAAPGDAMRLAQGVVTSPLTRAMQTCGLIRGTDCSVPVHVDPCISERWSAPCDEGTVKSELMAAKLPGLEDMTSWQGWEDLEERWWPECGEDQWSRAEQFLENARAMSADRLVFVGHGGFWETVTGTYLRNCEVLFCDRSLS